MTNKEKEERILGNESSDHQSLAENIGISSTLEDFGGGRGQAAGMQQSVNSQDQFDDDVAQIFDEDDYAGEVEPQPPYDYIEDDRENR